MVQPRIILATWLAAFQQASHGGAFASSHQYRLLFASINDHQTPVASLSYSQLPKPRRVQRRRSSSNTGPPPPQPELLLLLAAAEATTETTGDFESRQASSYKNETTKKDSVIAAETNIDHAVSSMPRGGGDAGSSVEPMEEEEESSLSSSSSSKDLVLPSLPVPELPTMMQYVKFALPCLGLWIAGPLLSLVDTSFVGLSGSSDMSARRLAGKNERKNPRRRGGKEKEKQNHWTSTALDFFCMIFIRSFVFLTFVSFNNYTKRNTQPIPFSLSLPASLSPSLCPVCIVSSGTGHNLYGWSNLSICFFERGHNQLVFFGTSHGRCGEWQ